MRRQGSGVTNSISDDWSDQTLIKENERVVTFTIDGDSTISSVTPENAEICTIEPVPDSETNQYTVTGLQKGKTNVTATLASGESDVFEVNVGEIDTSSIVVHVPDENLPIKEGENLNDKGIIVDVTVHSGKEDEVITVTPTFSEGTSVVAGENSVEANLVINDSTISTNISITDVKGNTYDVTSSEATAKGFEWSSISGGLQITGWSDVDGSHTAKIPDSIDGQPVISLADMAFANTGLTSIDIPASVIEIGNREFWNCHLTELTIGENVQTIKDGAFQRLEISGDVVIPDNIKIGNNAFEQGKFTNMTIGKNCTIGNDVFKKGEFTHVSIGEGSTMGTGCFQEICGLSDNCVDFPTSMKKLPDKTFYHCCFDSYHLPKHFEEVGAEAFSNSSFNRLDPFFLKLYISDYGSLEKIGKEAFAYVSCNDHNDGQSPIVYVPRSIDTIASNAFKGTGVSNQKATGIFYEGYASGKPFGANQCLDSDDTYAGNAFYSQVSELGDW